MPAKTKKNPVSIIRYVYLYLVTAITIVLIIISTIGLVHLVLDEYVFEVKSWEEMEDIFWECEEKENLEPTMTEPGFRVAEETDIAVEPIMTDAEKEECEAEAREKRELRNKNDVKRDLVTWLSMLIVALPLYLYHWSIIKKEGRKK